MNHFEIARADSSRDTIARIVALHRAELSGGFLSSLGEQALSVIFEFAAGSDAAILLVARNKQTSQIEGFILGCCDIGSFYKHFLRSKFLKALVYIGPQLLSMQKLLKILETLLYPVKRNKEKLPSSELLDLVVSKDCRGRGLGRILFCEFTKSLQTKGISAFKVTTGESLKGAHAFYEKLGARRSSDIVVHVGQVTRVYVYKTNE